MSEYREIAIVLFLGICEFVFAGITSLAGGYWSVNFRVFL